MSKGPTHRLPRRMPPTGHTAPCASGSAGSVPTSLAAAFRDCRRWCEDARAKTTAGLDQGGDQGWVLLLHAEAVGKLPHLADSL